MVKMKAGYFFGRSFALSKAVKNTWKNSEQKLIKMKPKTFCMAADNHHRNLELPHPES